jgi:hypothetical protein
VGWVGLDRSGSRLLRASFVLRWFSLLAVCLGSVVLSPSFLSPFLLGGLTQFLAQDARVQIISSCSSLFLSSLPAGIRLSGMVAFAARCGVVLG